MHKDIIIAGNVGESGAFRLAGENEDAVRQRFPGHIIVETELSDVLSGTGQKNFTYEELRDVMEKDPAGDKKKDLIIIEVGKKGLMKALWDLGDEIRSGFIVNSEKIPVSQLTVEICELFGEDPFKIESGNCFLICTDKGNELCEVLRERGVPAEVAGHSVSGRGKVMVMGEITRYIDKPRSG